MAIEPSPQAVHEHQQSDARVLDEVYQRLRRDLRVAYDEYRLELSFAQGELTLQGETSSIAEKRAALADARAAPGVRRVRDQLCVAPAVPMPDDEIRVHLRELLAADRFLAECSLFERDGQLLRSVREPPEERGRIRVDVREGVVTFEGEVPSLSHKRMAGVLAWWIPGTRDVRNELSVTPPEEDRDDEITDVVRTVFAMDPLLDESGIAVRTELRVVHLSGAVPTEAQREIAEHDAFFVWGVEGVENALSVVARGAGELSREAPPKSRGARLESLRKRALRVETIPALPAEIERLSADVRHLAQEHRRAGLHGSWRRRFASELSELGRDFGRALERLRPSAAEASLFKNAFHRRPATGAESPRMLRFRGRSDAGSVLEVWQRPDGSFDVELDGTLARRAVKQWDVASIEPGLALALDGVRYPELFDIAPEALEALRQFTREPWRAAPTAWVRSLREAGLIDAHYGLTARGCRYVAARERGGAS